MIHVTAKLKSLSPYSQSGFFQSEREEGESHDAFEKRCWREKLHVENGHVVIPAMAFKQAIDSAAQFVNEKIPGEGRRTWSKVFATGILTPEPVPLKIKPEDVRGEWINANANGKRGSGTRVRRCFPIIDEWTGDLRIVILNPKIEKGIFERVMTAAGRYIGVGRFRVENQGCYGRFEVSISQWEVTN